MTDSRTTISFDSRQSNAHAYGTRLRLRPIVERALVSYTHFSYSTIKFSTNRVAQLLRLRLRRTESIGRTRLVENLKWEAQTFITHNT